MGGFMTVRSHRDLRVWQSSLGLVEAVYRASSEFPRTELFGLQAQVRRAAISIPSNIAEGHARESTREFLRFLSIAMGSAAELQAHIELAQRLGYLQVAEAERLAFAAADIMKMLHGLRAGLRKRLPAPPRALFPNP